MKEESIALVKELSDPSHKLNFLREYLQAFVLRSLHESEAFLNLSFVGGTALRFLFSLLRFSEYLDFSLEVPNGYTPVKWMKKVERDLSLAGFAPTIEWNDKEIVHTAWIRIAEILKEIGLTNLPEQKLSIKLEIDTKPPKGAKLKTLIINRHMLFSLQHHDLASLMAGKVHALITRSYPKGRDWYDLVWYCTQSPPVSPNLELLQNALEQSGKFIASKWREDVCKQLDTVNTEELKSDVLPFLENPGEARLLIDETIKSLLTTSQFSSYNSRLTLQ